MKRIQLWTGLLLGTCLAQLASGADIWGGPVPPQPRLQPAFRAEDFLESLGLNASPFDRDLRTKYPPEVFFDLGIRYYRTGLKDDLTASDQPQRMTAAYEKYGSRPMLLIDKGKDGDPANVVALLKQYPAGVVAELEGPNELNNKFPPQELNLKYKGKTDEAAGAAYMDDYYRAVKADPATKDIPVVAFTAIFTDYRLAKPHTSFDFSSMHPYPGGGEPSCGLEMNETRFNNVLPPGAAIKPFVPTETGYNVEEDKSNHTGAIGSLQAQAHSIPMLYAEYFRHGIRRTYLFALHNADGFGLLENDQETKRPSYFMVKNFVAALKDASWNPQTKHWDGGDFTPKALLFEIPGAPETVHTLVLQKKSGAYSLLIWNELPNFDTEAHKDRDNHPAHVILDFKTAVDEHATVLTQNAKGEYDTSAVKVAGGKLELDVPSWVMIIRLKSMADAPTAAVPAPEITRGEASEIDAHLEWKPVPGAAGYFVFRNGWHIATVAETTYADHSSWLRPGLGYTYAVCAFDDKGNMSPKSEKIVTTAQKYPDLILTDVRPETAAIKPGDKVRFTSRVKNVGAGCTPPGIAVSTTWAVDGKVVSWGGRNGPIKPGEEFAVLGDGGPGPWTATAGTHVLHCVIDDVNRLPGEFKGNNMVEQTFVVGDAPKGQLSAQTQCAPGMLDLSKEGTSDWIHWGLADKASITRKVNGSAFSDLAPVGSGYCDATSGSPISIQWNDGAPVRETRDTHSGLWWNGVGTGRSFSVPADTKTRVLRVYVSGINGAAGTFTAKLSDGSAPDYTSNAWNGNASSDWTPVPDGFSAVYTVRYHAATPGQKLNIEWKLASEPNRFAGQARIQAATLADEP